MDDKYIITTNQQGQPENRKGAVGPSNVATSGDGETSDALEVGPDSIPEHPRKPEILKKSLTRKFATHPATPMKTKIENR